MKILKNLFKMVLTAHQPVYLPWLGLFHKIWLAEKFVLFNTVQYLPKEWMNRNKIKTNKTDTRTDTQSVKAGKPDNTIGPIANQDEVNEPKKDYKTKNKAEISIEELKGKWPEIVTSVTNLRTSIGMVLEHCVPLEFVGKKVQVGMVDQPRFNLDLLKNNKKIIEDVAANHVKQKIKIKFFTQKLQV